MSPINVAAAPGVSALRFSVSLAHVAPSEQPAFRWDLTLARPGPAATAAACTNSKLPGGQKVKANEIAWTNQGASFLWYGGGVDACRGTVAVVAENEYQQCSASLTVPLPDSSSGSGAPAACKLGGFTFGSSTLPVPAALLASSATATATLARLRGELQARALTAGAFERLVTPLLRQQDSSLSQLFPAVFGCGFARLFEPVLLAESGLDEQLATGTVSTSALASEAGYLQTAARTAAACRRTASNPAGASPAVLSGLAGLSAEAKGLLGSRPPAAGRLAALSARLQATLRRGFPPLFGISYEALLSRIAAADSAIALAEQSARTGKDGSAAGELAGALAPDRAIHQDLVRHQRHVIKVENANG